MYGTTYRCPIVPSRQDLEKEGRRDLRFDIVGDRSKEGGKVSQEGNSIDNEFVAYDIAYVQTAETIITLPDL